MQKTGSKMIILLYILKHINSRFPELFVQIFQFSAIDSKTAHAVSGLTDLELIYLYLTAKTYPYQSII